MTVDHFQPTSRGGADDESNWIYSCAACNTFKAAYWDSDSTPGQGLLKPLSDLEERDGILVGLTPRGERHVERLHLNREQLIAQRQLNARDARIADRLRRVEEVLKRIKEARKEADFELD